jgi:hypothetical protein
MAVSVCPDCGRQSNVNRKAIVAIPGNQAAGFLNPFLYPFQSIAGLNFVASYAIVADTQLKTVGLTGERDQTF